MASRAFMGSPWLLGFSFPLAATGLCLRADTPLPLVFAEHGLAWTFIFSLMAGVLVGSVVACRSSWCANGNRAGTVLALASGLLSAASLYMAVEQPRIRWAVGTGILLGASLCLAIAAWAARIRQLPSRSVLGSVACSFFAASLWGWLVSAVSAVVGMPDLLAVLVLAGTVPLLVAPLRRFELTEADGPFPEGQIAGSAKIGRVVVDAWPAWAAVLFNFFTLGLTFWPEAAGLVPDEFVSPKPMAYAVVLAVVAWFVCARKGRREDGTGLFCRICLPVAVAIMLASPFADRVLPASGSVVFSVASYVGIALCYVAGTAMLFGSSRTAQSAPMVVGVFCVCCVVSMGAGMAVFAALGEQAQVVSLCILAVYLMAMVLSEVRSATGSPQASSPAPPTALDELCTQLAESYGLSSRESEILPYLARGRGAKAVAEKLHISPETVRTHSKRIYEKMGVHTREELLDLIEKDQ